MRIARKRPRNRISNDLRDFNLKDYITNAEYVKIFVVSNFCLYPFIFLSQTGKTLQVFLLHSLPGCHTQIISKTLAGYIPNVQAPSIHSVRGGAAVVL